MTESARYIAHREWARETLRRKTRWQTFKAWVHKLVTRPPEALP